jgi:hypothetical protein
VSNDELMKKAFDECFGKEDILTFAEIENTLTPLNEAYINAELDFINKQVADLKITEESKK